MIETDIRTELTQDPTISAIVSTRVFLKNPIRSEQNGNPYISFSRQDKARNMVSQTDRFQLWVFSTDVVQLETLCDAIINLFEDKRSMNNNKYFSVNLIGQTDSRERLEDSFFWSVLTYEFKQTT